MIEHLSFSQYSSYTRCPRSWYLSKIVEAEEKQSWYAPIGTAVHRMVEAWLAASRPAADFPPAEAFFFPLVEKQMRTEPDTSLWLAGGPKADPVIELKALQKVRDCFERAVEYLEDIEVWDVEYDASGRLPGLSVPIRAYVDLVGEHKKQGPVIWDFKTGSTKPGNFQLETYAALLKSAEYPKVPDGKWKGRYLMLAPGSSETRYVDLSEVDPAEVGKKYEEVYSRMQQKLYPTNAGFGCTFCFHQDSCLVKAGPTRQAVYYDRSVENGFPF